MKVLILEDNEEVASGLVQVLGYLGHEGIAARSVGEAVALFDSCFDVQAAIADCGLQDGENGHDLLLWLRGQRPSVKRILTSALDRPADFTEDPPRQLFAKKPFGYDKLKMLLDM